jgi:NET1-associated nuclear protein 1 (U3 small nucleolar RNA-associated protein 17)
MKISPSNPNRVYIADFAGTVELWDWINAEKILSVSVDQRIVSIDVVASKSRESDLLYMLGVGNDAKGGMSNLYYCSIRDKNVSSTSNIHQFNEKHKDLQVFQSGNVIVCASNSSVAIGRIHVTKHKKVESNSTAGHNWKQLKFPEGLACFDARFAAKSTAIIGGGSGKDQTTESLHLVLGSQTGKGSIYVYEDIMKMLDNPASMKARKLHWHRSAVGSVKWSLDGKK